MTKQELMKKVEAILDDAEQNRAYTVIELEIRDGKPILVRTVKTEKVEYRGNESHVKQTSYNR